MLSLIPAGGWETFLSYEDAEQDVLVGLLRLRKCSEEGTFRKELISGPEGMSASVVRELVSSQSRHPPNLDVADSSLVRVRARACQHVYGTAIGVHGRNPKKFQHQGLGQLLMEEAERVARDEHGSWKLAVIAGIGTRDYYRRLGYELDGPYMSKVLI